MVELTIEMIIKRSKKNNINDITELNISNFCLDNISVIGKLKNLKILSLVNNYITNLKCLENNIDLEELYLRNNKINNIKQIDCLSNLTKLRILSLVENEITSINNYRTIIKNKLPQLEILDNILFENNYTNTSINNNIRIENNSSNDDFTIDNSQLIDNNSISDNNNYDNISENKKQDIILNSISILIPLLAENEKNKLKHIIKQIINDH